jgi:alginate O-acetyltransferase complex protein AlgI
MIFSSLEFMLVFLPVVGLLFWLARRMAGVPMALAVLTIASLIFYGFYGFWMVWRPWDLFLLLGSVVCNFLLSMFIAPPVSHEGQAAIEARGRMSQLLLLVGIVLNLGVLVWFKYASFLSRVAHDAGFTDWTLAEQALPLGVSFFTFVEIAYLVDRYNGKARMASFWRFLLFVGFFPHLLAGPIVHHTQMMPQLERPKPSWNLFALALFIFAVGLAKKTLIADPLAEWANAGFRTAGEQPLLNAWLAVLAYTMQLYFDFSGYSDMAIGLALMFGVQFPWNFLSPYRATSISQFWRSWHITLSNFLRDYVYIPLGGNRCGKVRQAFNLLAVMVVGGIWHGAGWTFMLWGFLHGIALVVNHKFTSAKKWIVPKPLAWALTMVVVVMGWVLFKASSFANAVDMYGSMFTVQRGLLRWEPAMITALPYLLIALLLALFTPNTRRLTEKFEPRLGWSMATGSLLMVSLLYILGRIAAPEFLYYDF